MQHPRWIYCDIDGTLTDDPEHRWGSVRAEMLERLDEYARDPNYRLVLWSGGGEEYVREFARKYRIKADAYLSKPHVVIDDNPAIRDWSLKSPEEFRGHKA